jgi:uncharacterized membrane protein YdcZ (DUF606 family)
MIKFISGVFVGMVVMLGASLYQMGENNIASGKRTEWAYICGKFGASAPWAECAGYRNAYGRD